MRKEVLAGIGKFKDPRSVAGVVRCFEQQATRDQAARALREMGSLAEKEVLPLLNHQDLFLRQAAVGLLKDIGTQNSVPRSRPWLPAITLPWSRRPSRPWLPSRPGS